MCLESKGEKGGKKKGLKREMKAGFQWLNRATESRRGGGEKGLGPGRTASKTSGGWQGDRGRGANVVATKGRADSGPP